MLKFTKKTLISLLTTVTVAVSVITGCSSNQTVNQEQDKQEQDTVKIGYTNILSMAPAVIAEKQKLMEKQGIKAEFYQFANGPDLNKALSSGKLDIAYTGIPVVVNWASRGADIKVIAKVGDGEFGLLAKEDSTITQPSDLEGKKSGF
jgi:ABC-type nitrate/sulfonate/bicarbonate transport system substrate-binding protein